MFHQHKLLKKNAVTTNAMCGSAMKTLGAKLQDSSTVGLPFSWGLIKKRSGGMITIYDMS